MDKARRLAGATRNYLGFALLKAGAAVVGGGVPEQPDPEEDDYSPQDQLAVELGPRARAMVASGQPTADRGETPAVQPLAGSAAERLARARGG